MVDNLNPLELELSTIIFKQLWARRNMVIFEDKFESPSTVMRKAKMLLDEYHKAQPSTQSEMQFISKASENNNFRWKQPTFPQAKLNQDVTLNKTLNTLGLGMIIRVDNGAILVSACCNRNGLFSPTATEALALRTAMSLYQDLGFPQVISKGDCKVVVEAATSTKAPDSKIYPLIYDIHQYLRRHLMWKVQYVHGVCNQVAHNLARLACKVHGDSIWMEECPMQVMSFVLADLSFNAS